MSATESTSNDPITFSGIINYFETSTHAGTIMQEERQPKRWDERHREWRDPVPAHWHVILSPVVCNRAWRAVNIPLARCRDMESAARLAMRLLPAAAIVMRGELFGGEFTVKRNQLVEIW